MMIFITNHKVKRVLSPIKQKETVIDENPDEEHIYKMNDTHSSSSVKNHYKSLKIPFTTHKKINHFLSPPLFGQTNQQTITYASPDHQTADFETYHFDITTHYQEQPYCKLSYSNVQTIFNLSHQPVTVPVKNNHPFQELTKSPVQNSCAKEIDETISNSTKPSPLLTRIEAPVILGEYDIEVCINETFQMKKGIVGIKEVSKEVVLTHCHFLPTSYSQSFDQTKQIASAGTLFVEGYIQEEIEYVPAINTERKPPREWIKKVFTHIDQTILVALKLQMLQVQQIDVSNTDYSCFE